MGATSSKDLRYVTTLEIQIFLQSIGGVFIGYARILGENGLDGASLELMPDEASAKALIKETFGFEGDYNASQLRLFKEWKNAKDRQAKRQKLLDETKREAVVLTDTKLFFSSTEVPKPPLADASAKPKPLTPFMGGADWLEKTHKGLMLQRDLGDDTGRALPTAFVRCSRGGKTRTMRELMHRMPFGEATIYVSFNNDMPLELQGYDKEPLQELSDRIGFAARKNRELDWLTFRDMYDVNSDSVGAWLQDENCTLFVDELNLLPQVTDKIVKFLNVFFLSKKGRCFCFSSHLLPSNASLSAFMPNPSNRQMVLHELPLVSSVQEARKSLGDSTLTARQVLYYGMIPGLLVERNIGASTRREIAVQTYIHQVNTLGEVEAHRNFRNLLQGFITGEQSSTASELQELTTAEKTNGKEVLRWIPYHLQYLLSEMHMHCPFLEEIRACLDQIPRYLESFPTAKNSSGDAFEALFVVVTLIRCLAGMECEILPLKLGKNFEVGWGMPYDSNDWDSQTDPHAFAANIPPELPEGSCDKVSIYHPGHAKFEAYDVLVAVWSGGKKRRLYGYQLKEGDEDFASQEVFTASYLIRGSAKQNEGSARLFTTCSEDQINTFFGVSGRQWTPNEWKALAALDR